MKRQLHSMTQATIAIILSFVLAVNGLPAESLAEATQSAQGAAPSATAGENHTAEPMGEETPAPAAQPATSEQPASEESVSANPQPTNDTNAAATSTEPVQNAQLEAVETAAVETVASQPTEPAQSEQPAQPTPAQATMPAQHFSATASNGVTVVADAAENTFPAATTMRVQPVDAPTAQAIGAQIADDNKTVTSVRAVDITFADALGRQVEPANGNGVQVSLTLPQKPAGELTVAHQTDDGTVEEIPSTTPSTATTAFTGKEFSVYAVVETTKIVTFEFFETEESTTPVRTQVVCEGDTLYAPGPPTSIPAGKQLTGWVISGRSDPIAFAEDGTHTLTAEDIAAADAGTTVRVNARYGAVHYATFYDQADDVFTRIGVAEGGQIQETDLPAKFVVQNPDQSLAGWSTTKNAATADVTFPITLTQDTPYYPVIASSHVIHFDSNRMLGMEENASYGYKKMTVSYTAPQVVAHGANTVEPATAPTAEGGAFTFAGWYTDAACTTPFEWGKTLDADITLYAKWTPGTTTYRVNVWKEKVDVLITDPAHTSATIDPSKFDFWSSTAYTAPVLAGSDGAYVPNMVSIAADAPEKTADHGFVYRDCDTEKIVMPDGTTELNVYWNREERSVTFHEGTEIGCTTTGNPPRNYFKSFDFTKTYTGLYDQSFSQYGWEWPQNSLQTTGEIAERTGSWRADYITYEDAVKPNTTTVRNSYVRGKSSDGIVSVHYKDCFNDALSDDYYYLVEDEPDVSLYYVRQRANGTWPTEINDPTITAIESNTTARFHVTDIFSNFEPSGYSVGSIVGESERHYIPRSDDDDEDMRIPKTENNEKRFVYYARDTHKVRFYTDASKNTLAFPEETKYWDQDISGYGATNSRYKLADPEDGSKTFAGWYYSPGVTDPSLAIDWTNYTMPANDIELYPIWVSNSVHVVIDPGADDVTLNDAQARSFWPSLGDTIDMTYLNAATRSNYNLVGWYLPNSNHAAAWSEKDPIGAELCDRENGELVKTWDPTYKNYYYTLTLQARWSYSRAAKVRYDLNDGTNGTGDANAFADSAEQYLFGGNVQVTTATPTPPDGKVFLAWQDKAAAAQDAHSAAHVPGSTFAYNDEAMVTSEGNQDYIVLTAVYVTRNAPTSTITYYPNFPGATSNPKVSETYEWGDQIQLPGDTFTREGYELAGWSDNAEVSAPGAKLFLAGSTVGVNALGTTIDDLTNRGNNTLYAVWRKVLTVESDSKTVAYNGQEQTVDLGFKKLDFVGDGGDNVRVTGLSSSATGTNVGTYAGTVAGTAKVIGLDEGADKDQDITERFKVETTNGTLTITPRDVTTEAQVSIADAGAYDGTQKKPVVTVKVTIGGVEHTLEEGRDFTVAYSNNVNAAEATAENAPIATVTFKGNYAGTASKTFSIAKATVTVTPGQAQSKVYGDAEPTLTYDVAGLVGSDSLTGLLGREEGEAAGKYAYKLGTLEVSGEAAASNYELTLATDATNKFTVTRKQLTFTWLDVTSFTYDATEKSIAATAVGVKSGDEVTCTLSDNAKTDVGTYTARVTGLGGAAADNYYFASDEPTASQAWSITPAKQTSPTATHTGASGKSESDGTVTVTPAVGTSAEYSVDGGVTWADVPAGNVISGLSAGDVLVRTKADANHDASDPVTQTVGYKLTGTVTWVYKYQFIEGGVVKDGVVANTPAQRSKKATVTLYNGNDAYEGKTATVTAANADQQDGNTESDTATYEFDDVPIAIGGVATDFRVTATALVASSDSSVTDLVPSTSYALTLDNTELNPTLSYGTSNFDVPWEVRITGADVAPDTLYVKVVYGETEDGVSGGIYGGYAIITQQVDGNGVACAVSGSGTSADPYKATGSYPVWVAQPSGGTYYHKILLTGYKAGGVYYSLLNDGSNYRISDKTVNNTGACVTYDSTKQGASDTMLLELSSLKVPVVELDPNGPTGVDKQYLYADSSTYDANTKKYQVTKTQIDEAPDPAWSGYEFAGWYDSGAKNGGAKVDGPVTLDKKTTLYAHWIELQAAPTGLTATKASTTADATISGVNGDMEYSTNGGQSWQDVTGSSIGGLKAGTVVQVRSKAVAAIDSSWPKKAGEPATVTIQVKGTQAEPELESTKATDDSTSDAKVTVKDYDSTSKPAQYQVNNSGNWVDVPAGGVITGLKQGDVVQVKYTETADFKASAPTSVTIGAKELETIKPEIKATSATAIQVTNATKGVNYTLCDASGTAIAGINPITATANGTVTFEGCTPGATYTVTPSIQDTDDRHYACERSGLATTPKLTIDTTSNAPVACTPTYDRTAQALVDAPATLPSGCTKIQYSLDGTTWNDDVPTAVDASTYTVHVRYIGDATHDDATGKNITATINPRSLTDADYGMQVIAMPIEFVYSGEAQGPTVTALDHATILTRGTQQAPADYTVSYGTATDVGNYTLTVTGTGNYKDSVDRNFRIVPYAVGSTDKLMVDLGETDYTYNGSVQRPENVTVTLNGRQLVESVDYDLAYLDTSGQQTSSIDAGGYQVKVTLKGNYNGETAAGYAIKPKSIGEADVTFAPANFVYSGGAQGPAFSVRTALKDGQPATTLAKDTDYLLTGGTATGAGTYTATISGTGNFTGKVEKSYTIAPYIVTDVDKLSISLPGGDTNVYDGTDHKPTSATVTLTLANGTTVSLEQGAGFTLSYLDKDGHAVDTFTNVGSYQVKATLTGNYEGGVLAGYTVTPAMLVDGDVQLSDGPFTYGSGVGPTVTVAHKLGSNATATTLDGTKDYTVAGNAAIDAGTHTITVTGTGNYAGTVTKTYDIGKATITVGDANKSTAASVTYNGEEQDLVKPPSELPTGCVKVQYSTDDGTTWSDDVPARTDAGQYPVKIKYVGDKNHSDLVVAALSAAIARRSVTLTGETDTRVFNGQEQKLTDITATGLVAGHVHNATYSAAGTNVGEYNGTITNKESVRINDAAGTNVTDNYDITTTPGTLTISKAPLYDNDKGEGLLANDEGRPITIGGTATGDLTKQVPLVRVTGTSETTIYDGVDHTPTVKDAVTGQDLPTSAYTVTYYALDDEGNQGAELTGDAATKNAGKKVAVVTFTENSNFNAGNTITVSMTILPRPVTFIGESASVVYDGQTHTLTGITAGGEGLVDGHVRNGHMTYSASGAEKGQYAGQFALPGNEDGPLIADANGANVSANYDVDYQPGTLTIGAQPVVEDPAGSGNVVEADGSGKPKKDGEGNTTTRVSVSFPDDAVYDGQPHEPAVRDVQGQRDLVSTGESPDYTVVYYHAADIAEDGLPNEGATPIDNVAATDDRVAVITFVNDYVGTVRVAAPVRKRPVTLTGTSASASYTGKEQSVTGVEDTGELKLVDGHTHNATHTAKGTNVGEHDGAITAAADVVITDAQGTTVTSNYEITTAAGTLTITPLVVNDGMPTSPVSTTDGTDGSDAKPVVNVVGSNPADTQRGHTTPNTSSGDAGTAYDGKEHAPVVTDAQGNALAPGTDFTVTYYDPTDIGDDGKPKDDAKPASPTDAGDKVAVVEFMGNYSGTVVVPVRVAPRELRVTTASATKAYDGTPLTATGHTETGLVEGEKVEVLITGSQTDVGTSDNTYQIRFAGEPALAAQSDGEAVGMRAMASTEPTAKRGNYALISVNGDVGKLTVTQAQVGDDTSNKDDGDSKRVVVEPKVGPVLYDTAIKDADGNPKQLVEGTDYTVTYYDTSGNEVKNPTTPGTYRMVITYQGNYAGTYETTVTIPSGSTSNDSGDAGTNKGTTTATPTTTSRAVSNTSNGSATSAATPKTSDTAASLAGLVVTALFVLTVGLYLRKRRDMSDRG